MVRNPRSPEPENQQVRAPQQPVLGSREAGRGLTGALQALGEVAEYWAWPGYGELEQVAGNGPAPWSPWISSGVSSSASCRPWMFSPIWRRITSAAQSMRCRARRSAERCW